MITVAIEAKEGRDVDVDNILWVYLTSEMYDIATKKLRVRFENIL